MLSTSLSLGGFFCFSRVFRGKKNGVVPWDSGELSIFMQMLKLKLKWDWRMGLCSSSMCESSASGWQNRTKYDPLAYIRSAFDRREFVKFNFEEFNLYLRMEMRLLEPVWILCALSADMSFCSWRMKFPITLWLGIVAWLIPNCGIEMWSRLFHMKWEIVVNTREIVPFIHHPAAVSGVSGETYIWRIWSTLNAHRSHGNWIESVRRTAINVHSVLIIIRKTHRDGYRLLYRLPACSST